MSEVPIKCNGCIWNTDLVAECGHAEPCLLKRNATRRRDTADRTPHDHGPRDLFACRRCYCDPYRYSFGLRPLKTNKRACTRNWCPVRPLCTRSLARSSARTLAGARWKRAEPGPSCLAADARRERCRFHTSSARFTEDCKPGSASSLQCLVSVCGSGSLGVVRFIAQCILVLRDR
jgi:hypothetical protein